MYTEVESYMKEGELKISDLPPMWVHHATMEHVYEFFKVLILYNQNFFIYFKMVFIEY